VRCLWEAYGHLAWESETSAPTLTTPKGITKPAVGKATLQQPGALTAEPR
jgi:hypothetical protein